MNDYLNNDQSVSSDVARDFIRSVYTYMFAALSISGIIAYTIGTNPELMQRLFASETGVSPLFYVVMFSPIIIVIAMSMGLERMSMRTILLLFIVYSVLMGLSLSVIFMAYTLGSIALTFFAASGAFGIMAVLGYTTKTDLTKFGSLLYMALGGIIIASIINMFMQSDGMDKMITYIGVFVFTGLVAYKMQMLKELAHNAEMDAEQRNKLALFGGLSLYITFINLFLTLLRLFGSRD
ncbi:MAG: Bax inhibitor-1/YccA family protein [Crocinitomicaceae bacterium]|jgi:FtsH-binding integral membrane protein